MEQKLTVVSPKILYNHFIAITVKPCYKVTREDYTKGRLIRGVTMPAII